MHWCTKYNYGKMYFNGKNKTILRIILECNVAKSKRKKIYIETEYEKAEIYNYAEFIRIVTTTYVQKLFKLLPKDILL